MPSRDWNQEFWGRDYDWPEDGDEWSNQWGGPNEQWFGALLPRIWPFLPATRILEIAPGHGRWTRYLIDSCQRLIGVDIAESCAEVCRTRFPADRSEFHANDGLTLPMVADGTIDFAFSCDSLVHADRDVVASYLGELGRVLAPDGVAFIHHSNMAEYLDAASGKLRPWGTVNAHSRAEDVSAEPVDRLALESGLVCIGQELVNWGAAVFNDAFSLVTPRGSRWQRQRAVLRNTRFDEEATLIAARSALYGGLADQSGGRTHQVPVAPERLIVAAFADEVFSEHELLATWARTFESNDAITLAVLAPGMPEQDVADHALRLHHLLGQPHSPDVVILTAPGCISELAPVAGYVYSRQPPTSLLTTLPRVSDQAIHILKANAA